MGKLVIPKKVVIEINDDGTYKKGIIQYQIRVNGVLDASKFYTMGVDTWLNDDLINAILAVAKNKIEEGETIPIVKDEKKEAVMTAILSATEEVTKQQKLKEGDSPMKKIISIACILSLIPTLCFGAWDKTKPANDELLSATPALIRANWEALETGTDSALLITNAKVAAGAAIADTKLATISTAGKVQGDALTLLANVPSGAGRLPRANAPLINTDTVVALADGAGSVINASTGNIFKMTATADRTLGTPTNATDGQKIVIRFTASGGARTLTLPVANTGDFAFGEDVTALTATTSGKTDYIGCIYSSVDKRWHVVAVSKGYST